MRLFFYYALHTFKNQLKKLFKTWVLIFLLVCMIFGGVIGAIAGTVASFVDESQPYETEESAQGYIDEEYANEEEAEAEEPADLGIAVDDAVELIAGVVILCVLLFIAFGADKSGSKIFLPADVNLLFASPMRPQSVLMFRLTTRLGMAVLGSAYLLFQIPNLTLGLGLSIWSALALIVAWCLTIVLSTLVQVLLYVFASTHPAVKRYLRTGIYALIALIAAGYFLTLRRSGAGYIGAAVLFFNARVTRFLPIWGWLKSFCLFAVQGNVSGALLCFAGIVAAGAALLFLIRRMKADFYEEAMAKSEETAQLLEAARSEKASGVVIKRKKDRSEKLRRDGLTHGSGANIFFFKTMYNRFRFAHFRFITSTMEVYLPAAVGIGVICRFFLKTTDILPVAAALAGLAFFRALGNPLEQDTKMDYFVLIPESAHAKLFWSLMGGTANCFLDVLLPIVAGALIIGENPLLALVWVPFIVSVDFYATNVGAFIWLSVPVSAGNTIKQVVQIMFIYFGLLPDIGILAAGLMLGNVGAAAILAAILNVALGFLFFGLSPLFLGPHGGKRISAVGDFKGDLRSARKQFSRMGGGIFAIYAVTFVLQLAAGLLVARIFPDGNGPSWLLWAVTFAPLYVIAIPMGLLILQKVPAVRPADCGLKFSQIVTAAIISIFMMYAGNLVGILITSLLGLAFGAGASNPVAVYAMDESLLLKILVMVILAPLIEEYVFRRQLIDRMRIYGERLAVITSALVFGMFHGNLSQFFYATALGLVFGYIYLKTGRLRYSAGLHMFVNFMGSIVGPFLLANIDMSALEAGGLDSATPAAFFSPQVIALVVYAALMIGLAVAGLVLFCIRCRDVQFCEAEMELPRGKKFKTVYLNVGMLLLIAVCAASAVFTMVQ